MHRSYSCSDVFPLRSEKANCHAPNQYCSSGSASPLSQTYQYCSSGSATPLSQTHRTLSSSMNSVGEFLRPFAFISGLPVISLFDCVGSTSFTPSESEEYDSTFEDDRYGSTSSKLYQSTCLYALYKHDRCLPSLV